MAQLSCLEFLWDHKELDGSVPVCAMLEQLGCVALLSARL